MSRSYRKTPMAGIASWNGIKWYKRYWNSRQRRRWKDMVAHGDFDNIDSELPWNEWDTPRDGKFYDPEFFSDKRNRSK